MADPNESNSIFIEVNKRRIKMLSISIPIVLMAIILIFLSISNFNWLPNLGKYTIISTAIFMLIIVAGVVYAQNVWKCPKCNSSLGKTWFPKYCPKCGIPLSK